MPPRKKTDPPRPPCLAPEGVKNLALGKPVTRSKGDMPMGELKMIVDGDKKFTDDSIVELGPFTPWVQIDLENDYNIYAVMLWHYYKEYRVYFDVVVQISIDKKFTSNVTTIFNNDMDNSLGLGIGQDWHYVETEEGLLVKAKGVKGQYVRCYSNGNTSNDWSHYIEVEVFGK